MSAAGEVRIDADWNGCGVTGVRLRNLRPQVARLLIGCRADEALARVPALFALCGKAQAAAAAGALAAAQRAPAPALPAQAIAAEAAQELLWRLLLDWPAHFDLAPRRARFAELHRRLAQAGAHGDGDGALAALLSELFAAELPAGLLDAEGELPAIATLAAQARTGGDLGAVLAELLGMAPEDCAPPPVFLPPPSAAAWSAQWRAQWAARGGVPDAAFCAAPLWQGVPAETGALARRHAAGPVGVLLQAGHRLAARLLATVLDALDWTRRLRMSAAAQPVVDTAALADAAGLACVDTARGVLIHAVRIEGERVADYAIVAPTEWNFHPDGAFVREAAGWTAPDRVAARRRLAALALGLNPCVPFAIELAEVGHA